MALGNEQAIRVRDYVPTPGNVDDGPNIRQAITDWQTELAAGTDCVLDFGIGNYRLSTPVVITNATGVIRGGGPQLCRINGDIGIGRMIQFNDASNLQISGIGLIGGYNGTVNGGGSDYGWVFASAHQDLGSTLMDLRNLGANGLARGMMFGDDQSPLGAAAEIVTSNLDFQFCTLAVGFAEFNTLDIVFTKPSWIHCGTGMKCTFQGVTQVFVYGGSSTNTTTDFDWSGNTGEMKIEGFRAEGGTNCTDAAVKLGGGNDDCVELSHCVFRDTTSYFATSVLINNGNGNYYIHDCHLNGSVRHIQGDHWITLKRNGIWVQGTDKFIDADPSTWIGSLYLEAKGNFMPSQINGYFFGSWHPFADGFMSGADLHNGNYAPVPLVPMDYKAAYSPATQYAHGCVTTAYGNLYVSNINTTGVFPAAQLDWDLLAQGPTNHILFADGFQSGDLSKWASNAVNGAGASIGVANGVCIATVPSGVAGAYAEVFSPTESPASKIMRLQTQAFQVSWNVGSATAVTLFALSSADGSKSVTLYEDNGTWQLGALSASGTWITTNPTTQAYNLSQWYSFELVADNSGSQSIYRLYVNGVLDATLTDTTTGTQWLPAKGAVGLTVNTMGGAAGTCEVLYQLGALIDQ